MFNPNYALEGEVWAELTALVGFILPTAGRPDLENHHLGFMYSWANGWFSYIVYLFGNPNE